MNFLKKTFLFSIIFSAVLLTAAFFYQNKKNKIPEKKINYTVYGAIIPHHQVAGFMVDDLFKRIKRQNPKVIVLVGPNHFEKGESCALSKLNDWDMSNEKIETPKEIIQELSDKKIIGINDDILEKEHSITSILSYIKQYLPQAKVATLIFKRNCTLEQINRLVDNFSTIFKNDFMVIASVDFSHYLTSPEAQEKDKITFELMKNKDYSKIDLLNNDYLDSPASIIFLIRLMDKLGKKEMEVIDNTNSGLLFKNDKIQTTSYFEIVFH